MAILCRWPSDMQRNRETTNHTDGGSNVSPRDVQQTVRDGESCGRREINWVPWVDILPMSSRNATKPRDDQSCEWREWRFPTRCATKMVERRMGRLDLQRGRFGEGDDLA